MTLHGPFRSTGDANFAAQANRANDIYLEAVEQLAEVLAQHVRSFTVHAGSHGLILYSSWALSGLLEGLERHGHPVAAGSSQNSPQPRQHQPTARTKKWAELLHTVVRMSIALSMRYRLSRGLLRVTAERIKTIELEDPDTAALLLPETCRLLRDFETYFWNSDEFRHFSSVFPEFSSTTRQLLKHRGVRQFQLTEQLEKLRITEN